jgi:hypothetical protein
VKEGGQSINPESKFSREQGNKGLRKTGECPKGGQVQLHQFSSVLFVQHTLVVASHTSC